MKKKLGVLTLVLALAFPVVSFAATSNASVAKAFRGFCGINSSSLTTQQKADLLDSFKSMMVARKTAIQNMVKNGTLTQEQGAAATNQIDQMIKYRQENGFNGSCGVGGGYGAGCAGAGACGGGFGPGARGANQVY